MMNGAETLETLLVERNKQVYKPSYNQRDLLSSVVVDMLAAPHQQRWSDKQSQSLNIISDM